MNNDMRRARLLSAVALDGREIQIDACCAFPST